MDVSNLIHPVDGNKPFGFPVIIDERFCLLLIDVETPANGFRFIVIPLV
jgi:hypothetical protein